jgi:hypothetical protein
MNAGAEYRGHGLHHGGPHPFGARFPQEGVMIPGLSHDDQVSSYQQQPLYESQLKKATETAARSFADCAERRNNDDTGYKATTSSGDYCHPSKCPPPSACYKGRAGKMMVDVATMTDPEEDQSWQNVPVPPNTKVAEYLSSLRQFLKVSSTSLVNTPILVTLMRV